jgi:hypothetical protein
MTTTSKVVSLLQELLKNYTKPAVTQMVSQKPNEDQVRQKDPSQKSNKRGRDANNQPKAMAHKK